MMTFIETETSIHCKLLIVLLQYDLFDKYIEIYKKLEAFVMLGASVVCGFLMSCFAAMFFRIFSE
jgi:hypothetical protein